MKKYNLSEFKGGWFMGDFKPTLLQEKGFEGAVKYYQAGTCEPAHYHKIATEWTVITSGEVEINDIPMTMGEIVMIVPGEVVRFIAITDACTTVIKVPSITGDKFIF